MADYKEIVGLLGTVIGMAGYIPYIRNILINKAKPHAFSWFIWSLITGIVFYIQWVEGAGPGSWVTGVTCLVCSCIFMLSLLKGTKTFPLVDWAVLILTLAAIGVWQLMDNPSGSIVLITFIDVFAYVPTIRKAFYKPFEENAVLFVLDTVKWGLSLFALEAFTISTWLYPVAMALISSTVVIVLLIQRSRP